MFNWYVGQVCEPILANELPLPMIIKSSVVEQPAIRIVLQVRILLGTCDLRSLEVEDNLRFHRHV